MDEGLYPDEFNQLIGKKFAFKIEVSQFNVDKKVWVFKVLKLTDNPDIISELETKANNYEVRVLLMFTFKLFKHGSTLLT